MTISSGPISGAPISAADETVIVERSITSTFVVGSETDAITLIYKILISELEFALSDGSDSIAFIESALDMSDTLTQQSLIHLWLEDNLSLRDAMQLGFAVSLEDSLALADDPSQVAYQVRKIASALGFSLSDITQADLFVAFTTGMVFSDLLQTGRNLSLTSLLELANSSESYIRAAVGMISEIEFVDDFGTALVLFGEIESKLVLSEDLDFAGVFNLAISSGLNLFGSIILGDEVYSAWVLNPANNTFTEYTNFRFNSFVSIGAQSWGFNETGMYLLDGDSDEGINIVASLKSGLIDFGVSNLKNVRDGFFGLTADGELLLKTTSTRHGNKRVDYYRLRPETGDTTYGATQNFSKSVWSRYWQFEVENVDGGDFELDEIEWNVVMLRRKS